MYELPWFNDRRRSPSPVEVLVPTVVQPVDLPSPSADHIEAWQGVDSSPGANRKAVHTFYRAQKPDIKWAEANRLAHRRAAHEGRIWGHPDLGSYAESYRNHLSNVVAEFLGSDSGSNDSTGTE